MIHSFVVKSPRVRLSKAAVNTCCVAVALLLFSTVAHRALAQEGPISFAEQIRPILSENCFQCHGPDEASREADLRLDSREQVLGGGGDTGLVVAGDPDHSLLVERIETDDDDLLMPPPDSGKELTVEQRKLLRGWIEQGAPWATHWAFIAPVRPDVPSSNSLGWGSNAIDAFVLRQLESRGLAPSSRPDRATLARRLYLDLTGLPPTLEELETFLADESPQAYERLVDALLESPHYGEKWGRHWLDAARYADSDGFEKDKPRSVWFYRDWVIQALNDDMPYDEFVIKQVAGDLLPDATQADRVATGFLRNSMINEEGGVDPEQFRMAAMFDRMDALGKSVLGLTIQCGQCHSHKYDPISQVDYYRMFAFINNCDEAQPTVYTPAERVAIREVEARLAAVRRSMRESKSDWESAFAAWLSERRDELEQASDETWTTLQLSFDDTTIGGQKFLPKDDGSYLAQGYAPTKFRPKMTATLPAGTYKAIRLELLTDPNLPRGGPGRSIFGTAALTEFEMEVRSSEDPDSWESVEFAAAYADCNPPQTALPATYDDRSGKQRVTGPVDYALDRDDLTAWGIDLDPARRNQARVAVFQFGTPLSSDQPLEVAIYLKQNHGGWNSDDNQTHNLGRFRLSVSEQAGTTAAGQSPRVIEALCASRDEWTADQEALLFDTFAASVEDWSEQVAQLNSIWSTYPEGRTQLVLQSRATPRATHVLERGDFLKPLQEVEPGVPEVLHPMPESDEPGRLRLARWLVARDSPTTARTIVNRVWQQYFGIGLVESSEDLGSQGTPPSHPELLDWLAVEFMEQGWRLKSLHRLIVTSETYRQSSRVTPVLQELDPYNRLLGRGARFRLPAESVRDVALASSGLLNRDVGGPAVYPPAPEFLFVPPASYGPKTWKTAEDDRRYRRAVYTFRFRSVPYPALEVFDAPNADVACVRRALSNTPLQALTTLNEPLFVRCAQALAERVLQDSADDAGRLEAAFRSCVSRSPDPQEREVLLESLDEFRQAVSERWNGSDESRLGVEQLARAQGDEAPELVRERASWTLLCRVLLNLDETITKE